MSTPCSTAAAMPPQRADGVDGAQVVLVAAGHRHARLHVDAQRGAVQRATRCRGWPRRCRRRARRRSRRSMRRASCAAAPVCTTAGPTTAIVSLPSSRTRRSRRATSWMICALGFSLRDRRGHELERLALARALERHHAHAVVADHVELALADVAQRDGLGAVGSGRCAPPRAAIAPARRSPSRAAPRAPTRRRGARTSRGWSSSRTRRGRRRRPAPARARVLGRDRDGAVLLDRGEDLLEVRPVAPEDAKHGRRDVGLGAPHVERQDLELAFEVHDVVHDLRHHERVDQVPLDADVFVRSLRHDRPIISHRR